MSNRRLSLSMAVMLPLLMVFSQAQADLILKLEGFDSTNWVVGTTYNATGVGLPQGFTLEADKTAMTPDPEVQILATNVKPETGMDELLGGILTIFLDGTTPLFQPESIAVKAGSGPGDSTPFSPFTSVALNTWEISFDLVSGAAVSNIEVHGSVVPLPAAVWLFGSALAGMVGIGFRRSRKA